MVIILKMIWVCCLHLLSCSVDFRRYHRCGTEETIFVKGERSGHSTCRERKHAMLRHERVDTLHTWIMPRTAIGLVTSYSYSFIV